MPLSHDGHSRGGALTLSAGTLLSRILGFVRDALVAALLGGGWVADAFLAAFRLPNFTRRLLSEGAFAYTLLPAYGRARSAGAGWVFTRSAALWLGGFFALLAGLGAAFSGTAAWLVAPGLESSPGAAELAAGYLRLCLPYLPLAAVAAAASAVLLAEERFLGPALSPAALNVVVIAAAGAAWLVFGPESTGGGTEGDAGQRVIRTGYALCAGVVLGGAAQVLCQLRALWRLGFRARGPVRLADAAVTGPLRALPGSAFGAAGNQVNILAAAFLASFLGEGGISALYFAERLIEFPVGLIGASLGMASLVDLSRPNRPVRQARLAGSNGPGMTGNAEGGADGGVDAGGDAFAATLGGAMRLTLFFGLPAAFGTACLARPITALIFGHGLFGPEALDRTAWALLAYTAGLPALTAMRPLLAALGALGDSRAPLRAALAGLGVTVVLGLAGLWGGHVAYVALAVSAGAWGNAYLLAVSLEQRGIRPLPGLAWAAKAFASCAVMAGCVLYATAACATDWNAVFFCVPLGVFVYFAAAWAFGLREAKESFRRAAALIRSLPQRQGRNRGIKKAPWKPRGAKTKWGE